MDPKLYQIILEELAAYRVGPPEPDGGFNLFLEGTIVRASGKNPHPIIPPRQEYAVLTLTHPMDVSMMIGMLTGIYTDPRVDRVVIYCPVGGRDGYREGWCHPDGVRIEYAPDKGFTDEGKTLMPHELSAILMLGLTGPNGRRQDDHAS